MCQIEERHEVERVVVEDCIHIALEAGADIVSVDAGNCVAWNVGRASATANVLLERLKTAVGQPAAISPTVRALKGAPCAEIFIELLLFPQSCRAAEIFRRAQR